MKLKKTGKRHHYICSKNFSYDHKLICSIKVINTGGDKYDSISVLKLRLKKQVERYIYLKKEAITNIK